MQAQRRRFQCEKPLALGTSYDALEKLNWTLLSANSDAGLLFVTEPTASIPFLIRICSADVKEVEITMELASGVYSGWSLPEESAERLFAALTQMLENTHASEAGRSPSKKRG